MKFEAREAYWLLAILEEDIKVNFTTSLCQWCKYGEFTGGCSDSAELFCLHPLEVVRDDSMNVWGGSDCWGFRPLYPQDACVDAVGLMLQGKYPDFSTIPKLGRK